LHDLEKSGKRTPLEWETGRLHRCYTQRILEMIPEFQHLAFIASAHHETLDGTRHCRGLRGTPRIPKMPFWRLTPGPPLRETVSVSQGDRIPLQSGFMGSPHRSRSKGLPNRDMICCEVPHHD
jgi:hypothetical protein